MPRATAPRVVIPPPVQPPPESLPPALNGRLDAFAARLSTAARTASPAMAYELGEIDREFRLLLRDLKFAFAEATTQAEPETVPAAETVPDEQTPARPAPPRTRPTPRTGPVAATEGRLLPDPCTKCGGKIFRPEGAVGRNPKRCAACRDNAPTRDRVGPQNGVRWRRSHPTSDDLRVCSRCGEEKPDDDEHFQLKNHRTGLRDALCRPCRSEYAKARYARVGSKVVTVELIEGDVAVGQKCGWCEDVFHVGEHISASQPMHEICLEEATAAREQSA